MKLMLQILSGFGLVLLALAGLAYANSLYFVSRASLASGTVVALPASTDPDTNATTYCPQVSFTTASGQAYSFNSNVCSAPPAYLIGGKVDVYYDPQAPQDAQIKDVGAQYLTAMSLTCAGLPIAVVGLFGLYLLHKRRPAASA